MSISCLGAIAFSQVVNASSDVSPLLSMTREFKHILMHHIEQKLKDKTWTPNSFSLSNEQGTEKGTKDETRLSNSTALKITGAVGITIFIASLGIEIGNF